ncbi:MAG: response regulator [Candidatus Omnitrophota bacterium]|nr:response regulator [Candidatus Omnitrophota bacterium]
MSEKLRLLLVEDDDLDIEILPRLLDESDMAPFDCAHCGNLTTAERELEGNKFDVILLDLNLPDSSGLETVERVRCKGPGTPIVVLTGHDDVKIGIEAIKKGAQDFLLKGDLDARLLTHAIRYAMGRKEVEMERDKLVEELQSKLEKIKVLKGLIPVCSWCRKVRNDAGFWNQFEDYVTDNSEAEISHGICPNCEKKVRSEPHR